jgi:hypothetical protein
MVKINFAGSSGEFTREMWLYSVARWICCALG